MNTSSRSGQPQPIVWLGVSHLAAAAVGALGLWLAPGHLPFALRLAAAILAGAALGLLLNGPILRAVEHLTVAPVPDGYTIRAMGPPDEHPARSWASWRAFHAGEPDAA